MEKIIQSRIGQKGIGFNSTIRQSEEETNIGDLFRQTLPEDLIKFGLIPEFVGRHVLDNQPKGYAIAYDSKQKYRKGTNYFCDTLSKAVTAVNGTLLKGNKHAYIIVDYNMEEDNTLENEYTRIVMTIRDVFKNSIMFLLLPSVS